MWLLPAVPLKPPVLAGMGGCFPAPAVLLALFSIFPFSRLPDRVAFLRRQSCHVGLLGPGAPGGRERPVAAVKPHRCW